MKVDITDLIAGGVLTPGMAVFPARNKYSDRIATLLPDGKLIRFRSEGPTEAASYIAGKRIRGWWFFIVDQASKRSLRDVRRDYIETMAVDADDDESDEDVDDEEI